MAVRKLTALAFLPVADVAYGFDLVVEAMGNCDLEAHRYLQQSASP